MSRKENRLIIIEKGQLTSYVLDDKNRWEIGRASKDNHPDIKLHAATISRKHGCFQNEDGIWFYTDYNGKNGTALNYHHINPGLNGSRRPKMLKDGDVFLFGGSEVPIVDHQTVWALYTINRIDDSWRIVDTKGCQKITYKSGSEEIELCEPVIGKVTRTEEGMGIYMGDFTYVAGDIEVVV